jgi:hypothetical protein
MTRQSVLDKIKKSLEVHTILINGNKQDKSDAFYIMMNTQETYSDKIDIFYGIKNSTLDLLREAEIDYEILNKDKSYKN